MDFESWRSLNFLVPRYFSELLNSGFVKAQRGESGWLGASGYVVLRRDETWIRVVRHMGEAFVEMAFAGPPRESDWFDITEVLTAIGVQFDTVPGVAPIPHRMKEKAAALIAHMDEIERAVRDSRARLLSRLTEIREEGVRQGVESVNGPSGAQSKTSDPRPQGRRSSSSGP
jgi:hypothetical protein